MSKSLYPFSQHDSPHARLYFRHLTNPAWRSLSGNAFKLLACLLAEYRPANPNSFPAGERTVARMIGVSRSAAVRAVNELIEKGHLRQERGGKSTGSVATRERVVSLTRWHTETVNGDPELPIKLWNRNAANAPELVD
jgi:DNA-binding MarR family transcriptional regulator